MNDFFTPLINSISDYYKNIYVAIVFYLKYLLDCHNILICMRINFMGPQGATRLVLAPQKMM